MARKLDPKSKSGFIRAQPASMTAADVVAAGRKAGINFATFLVYSVRSAKKGKAKAARAATKHAAGGGEIPIPYKKHEPDAGGLVAEIERMVERKVDAMLKAKLGSLLG